MAKKVDENSLTPAASAIASLSAADREVIGIGDRMRTHDVLRWIQERGFCHVVQQSSFEFEKELKTSVLMNRHPEIFLERPLAAILCPSEPSSVNESRLTLSQFEISDFESRRDLMNEISRVLQPHSKAKVITADITHIADEMLTYAVFNAPVGELQGAPNYNPNANPGTEDEDQGAYASSMSDPGEAPAKHSSVFLGKDDARLVIGCRDPFGTINGRAFVRNLYEYFTTDLVSQVRTAEESASTQAFQMINSSISFYAGFEAGRTTVLCCAVPLGVSARKREQFVKNFHYFVKGHIQESAGQF